MVDIKTWYPERDGMKVSSLHPRSGLSRVKRGKDIRIKILTEEMEVEVSRDGFFNAAVMYATNLQQMGDTSSRWNILITKVA